MKEDENGKRDEKRIFVKYSMVKDAVEHIYTKINKYKF